MQKKMINSPNPRWAIFLAIAVFTVYVYYLPRYAFPEIWGNIYCVYYMCLIPILIAFTLYFRRLNEPMEIKLILIFWGWVFITRLLNGDYYLTKDADMVINTGMIYVFLVACIALKGKSRDRFLDWISIITAVFYTLVALVCLYAVLFRKELYNPFTGDEMCGFMDIFRLTIFTKNPNNCCMWFFLAFFMLVYLFSRKKSVLWRVAIITAAALNYVILGMTFSRNGMLAFSLCIGLLVVMLLLSHFPAKTLVKKLLVTTAVLCLVVPLAYKSFSVTAIAMNSVSAALVQGKVSTELTNTTAEQDDAQASYNDRGEDSEDKPLSEEEGMYIDDRGFEDSGRIDIFKSIIPTMQQEPMRLLRGCLCLDVMKISNTVLPKWKPHFHNTFLQLFCLTGVLGLGLVLAFCLLLAIRIIRLFYSDAALSVKALTLILIGSFSYNMLEVSLFVSADIPAFAAYIVAGAVLAYSYETKAAENKQRTI